MATYFTRLVDTVPEDVKLAPQARVIFDALPKGEKVERKAAIELLNVKVEAGALTTRQEPERLLSFYQNRLDELGLVKIDRESASKEEKPKKEKAEKPAKGSKAKAEKIGGPESVPADVNLDDVPEAVIGNNGDSELTVDVVNDAGAENEMPA